MAGSVIPISRCPHCLLEGSLPNGWHAGLHYHGERCLLRLGGHGFQTRLQLMQQIAPNWHLYPVVSSWWHVLVSHPFKIFYGVDYLVMYVYMTWWYISTTLTINTPWYPCRCERWDINSSPPGQNGRHFVDDIFKCIFLMTSFAFWSKFHWCLFLRVKLTITKHWFR